MRLLRLCLMLLVFGIIGCAGRTIDAAEKPFVGTWYSSGAERSQSWRLSGDGRFGRSEGFVTPQPQGQWRVEGDTLIISVNDAEQRYNVKVSGSTLTVRQGDQTNVFVKGR